jgi:PAS domain S-box-containing protein
MDTEHPKRILLVEKSDGLTAGEKADLGNRGYSVQHVHSATKALQLIFENLLSVDLLLINPSLDSETDGIETAKKIVEQTDIPIVFLLSGTETELMERVGTLLSYGYVVKNSGSAILEFTIKNALELFNKHKAMRNVESRLQAERKETEEALRESEEKYRRIVDTAHEGIWLLDVEGKTTYTNRRMAEMLGYERGEMDGHGLFDFMDNDARIEAEKLLEKRRKGISEEHDFRFRRKDGTTLWAIVSTSAIMDSNGTFIAAMGLVTDVTERKRVEQDLRESEERLRRLVQNMFAGIVLHAADTSILMANDRASILLGLSQEQMMGKAAIDPAWRFVREDGSTMPLDEYPVNQVISTQMKLSGLVLGICRSAANDVVWVTIDAFPEFEADGTLRQVVVTFIDITERKCAEDALRESEKRFRSVFSQAPMGIAIVDSLTARFSMVNPALAQMIDYRADELLGMDWVNITHPDDVQPDKDLMAEMNSGKIPGFQLEKRYKHSDGHYFWVKITVAPMLVEDKSKPQHVLMVEDVTQRKQAELKTQEMQDILCKLIENSPIYTYIQEITSTDVRALYTSENMIEVTGISAEKMREKSLTELFPGDFGQKILHDSRRIFENGTPEYLDESFNDRFYQTIKYPFWAGSRQLLGGFSIDITERKQYEQALEHARTTAENASRAKSQFLASMSHELRTPLNPVIGFSELLALATNLTDEQRRWLDIVKERGNDLLFLINDILDFSKIEAGKLSLQFQELSLHDLISNMIETIRPAAQKKGLALDHSWAKDLPNQVLIDGFRLRQILLNLLNNAIKFTKAGNIEVRAALAPAATLNRPVEPDEVAILFRVSDTGIGIPKHRQKLIFDAFEHASEAHAVEFGGAGLGLAIAASITSMMGGSIWVEDNPEHGSVFSFTIIVKQNEMNLPSTSLDKRNFDSSRPLNILIAEDDLSSSVLIEQLIGFKNDRCKVVNSGERVLAALETESFDLILMDVRMPGKNGIETTIALREKGNNIPIIGVSANALITDKKECLAAGMNDYLVKPISLSILYAAIDKVLAALKE